MAETVALIDYGAGNLHSVDNALRAVGAQVLITCSADDVARADRIVLPGVGSFKACMEGLSAIPDMTEQLHARVMEQAAPFLGICVGMQLMAEYGEENGLHEGLSWVPGSVKPMEPTPAIKVPHMGWNRVEPMGAAAGGGTIIEPGEAYFLHSYAYQCAVTPSPICALTDHGGPITAAIQTGSAIGVQFHPEKSQTYGLKFLQNFLEWKP